MRPDRGRLGPIVKPWPGRVTDEHIGPRGAWPPTRAGRWSSTEYNMAYGTTYWSLEERARPAAQLAETRQAPVRRRLQPGRGLTPLFVVTRLRAGGCRPDRGAITGAVSRRAVLESRVESLWAVLLDARRTSPAWDGVRRARGAFRWASPTSLSGPGQRT